MTECTYWKKYKGIYAPRCLGGKGCDRCWDIYKKKHPPGQDV